jgi:hypothetical protein
LAVAAFWRCVNTAEVDGRGVVAPVLVRVVSVGTGWAHVGDVFPTKSKFIKYFIIVGVTHQLAKPIIIHIIIITIPQIVVGAIIVAIIITMPQ